MLRKLRNFLFGEQGSLASGVAIAAIPLFGMAGLAFDYTLMTQKRSALQDAADSAAIAGTRELAIASTKDDSVHALAKQYVLSNLSIDRTKTKLVVTPKISRDRSRLTVELDYYWKPFLIQYLDTNALPISVSSTASLAGSENLCVIALDADNPKALAMTGQSTVTASGCAIYSNSVDPKSISVVSRATLKARSTYSGGGYEGPSGSYLPNPVTDSPVIEDPLSGRAAPPIGSCDEYELEIDNGNHTLYPGVYCDGLTIEGSANVTLRSGEYIIKGGPLIVKGNATVKGEHVGFYFDGDDATFDFGVSTQVSLSAPKSGPLTGLLFFESHDAPDDRVFTIRSKDAEKFEGTVYLPKGKLIVDKESKIGQLSDWTAIIANQIEIRKGPQLVINSDYAGSDIPVPEGIGPSGREPRLIR